MAHLLLPKSLECIDLTPLFKKGDDIELTIEHKNGQMKKHNIDWKSLFKLYVLFKMGNLNRPELEWTPDLRFKDVILTF